jgi:4-hydroxy-3-methylbut-2-enyl diphosphate reductase IspH
VCSGTLILRAHGTTLEEKKRISRKNLRLVDATCPFVARAQKKAGEFASEQKTVLIVGDREHPEVKAILSHCGPDALCVKEPSEIDGMSFEGLEAGYWSCSSDNVKERRC